MTASAHSTSAAAIEEWSTPDGRRLTIRPVAPDDGPIISAFIRDLSPASRHSRFHGGVTELSARLLERFTNFDYRVDMALIATAISAERNLGVGEARYASVEGKPDTREFAIVVADAWQGLGIGLQLLHVLIRHAERCKVRRIYGDVLADNASLLGLARKFGFTLRAHSADARQVRVEKTLFADSCASVFPMHRPTK